MDPENRYAEDSPERAHSQKKKSMLDRLSSRVSSQISCPETSQVSYFMLYTVNDICLVPSTCYTGCHNGPLFTKWSTSKKIPSEYLWYLSGPESGGKRGINACRKFSANKTARIYGARR